MTLVTVVLQLQCGPESPGQPRPHPQNSEESRVASVAAQSHAWSGMAHSECRNLQLRGAGWGLARQGTCQPPLPHCVVGTWFKCVPKGSDVESLLLSVVALGDSVEPLKGGARW